MKPDSYYHGMAPVHSGALVPSAYALDLIAVLAVVLAVTMRLRAARSHG